MAERDRLLNGFAGNIGLQGAAGQHSQDHLRRRLHRLARYRRRGDGGGDLGLLTATKTLAGRGRGPVEALPRRTDDGAPGRRRRPGWPRRWSRADVRAGGAGHRRGGHQA